MKTLTLVILLAVLGGCSSETLYSQLDEREANEMLAVLLSHGVQAEKAGLGGVLEIRINRSDLPRAIALLSERGYPREQFDTLGEVFQREGFVSSPTEERARLLYALSQELANTLSTIDGVVVARVHLAIPQRHALAESLQPASASVFIKYRNDAAVIEQAASIKALVVNSIEGLPYDNVTVTFFPARSTPLQTAQNVAVFQAGFVPERWQIAVSAGACSLFAVLLLLFHGRRKPAGIKR